MASSDPRILIAAGIYPPDPGGPATHAKAQYDYFQRSGIPVSLVILAHYRHLPFGIRHLVYAFRLFGKAQSADIVYAHDAVGVGIPAFLVARFLKKRIVVRIGGDIPWEREAESGRTDCSMREWYAQGTYKTSRLFRVSRFFLKRFDAIIVTTSMLADIYAQYYDVSPEKLHMVPNPVPERRERPVVKGTDIIYASRLVAYKHLDFVIKTLSKILPQYPEIRLVIMGDGPERDRLEALALVTGMAKQVIFTGKVSQEEVLRRTRECLCGLAPALTEFNPNYILQCIAYGKPFLISRENGLPYAVPERLVFDPRDGEDLKKKISSFLTSESYAQAERDVRDIAFSMSWDDNLHKNVEIIESLLKGSK